MSIKKIDAGDRGVLNHTTEEAVVQVYAQIVEFNWLEPYATTIGYEQKGSGFFIDERGFIVTNAHVVSEAKSIWIQMPPFGQQIFFADLVGFCPERDLALLSLKDEDCAFIKSHLGYMPFLPLGDSDQVQRTDNVIILGFPLGQNRIKSSTGVVSGWESGIGRSWIQVTAPINPGNSGGPLINESGHVIGIAVSVMLSAQNVGYVIPINEFKMILSSLYESGLVRRANLGMAFNNGSDALAHLLHNPIPAGTYIHYVYKNSLAESVGIHEGDMLYECNGYTVDAYADVLAPWSKDKTTLHDLMARMPIGQPVTMTLYRSGKVKEVTFIFEQKELSPIRTMYPDYEEIDYEVIAGMVVMQLSLNHIDYLIETAPLLVEYTRLERQSEPALILTQLLPGSSMQCTRALNPGDIITHVNKAPVATLDQFRQALSLSHSTGILSVTTSQHVVAACMLKDVVAAEGWLADYFGYTLSVPVIRLLDSVK